MVLSVALHVKLFSAHGLCDFIWKELNEEVFRFSLKHAICICCVQVSTALPELFSQPYTKVIQ